MADVLTACRGLERDVLGAALVAPEVLVDLRVPPDELSDHRAADTLAAMLVLHQRGDRIELRGVRAELDRAGKLSRVGVDYLADIANAAAPISGAVIERLHELTELRRLRTLAQRVLSECESGNVEAAREMHAELSGAEVGFGGDAVRIRDMAVRACAEVVRAAKEGKAPGLPFGIAWLNRAIGGMRPGDMLTLGAPTGTGKSRFVMTNLLGMAKRSPVGWISCEDAESRIGERYGGIQSGISPLEMATTLHKDPVRVDNLSRALQGFEDPPIFVQVLIGKRDHDVLSAMRRMAYHHGCKHLVVDYVQAVRSSSHSAKRADQIGDMASAFKGQAHRLGCSLTLVSQLVRPARDRNLKKWEPSMHDLKESGDLENASEAIVLLWPDVGDDGENTGRVRGRIAKGKSGAAQDRAMFMTLANGQLVEMTGVRS